jgi:hypothetical protein
MEQLRGLLLEAHAREQVVDALVDGKPWVLVGIELAVPVQVAKGDPVGAHTPAPFGAGGRVG